MNKIKYILIFLTTFNFLYANKNIEIQNIGMTEGSLKYEHYYLNKSIQITPGCKSINELFKEIEQKLGIKILNNTNIDLNASICGAYKYTLLGDVLNNIIPDLNITFYEKDQQHLVLEYATEHSIKLPMNWDINKTKEVIKEKFPNIKIYTFGQTIRMVGNSQEMIEGRNVLNSIDNWSKRELSVSINITKLNSKEVFANEVVIAKVNKSIFEESFKINASHGLIFPIQNLGSIVFDFQKNSVVFNGNKFIPFNDLRDYAFLKDGYQISFDVPFGFVMD